MFNFRGVVGGVDIVVSSHRWKRQQNTGSQAAGSESRPVFHLYLDPVSVVYREGSPP